MKSVYNYQFILTPINQLMRSIMNDDKEENADYKEFADEKQEAQRKGGRVEERHNLNMQTICDKKYAVHQGKLISLRRKAKTADNLFVEPEAKLICATGIVDIVKQLYNGVFLKLNKRTMNISVAESGN
eukprot:3377840-Heterocapsa_arctica.AAC.1